MIRRTVNFDKVNGELAACTLEPEIQEREKRKALFVSVTELWQSEEDIDYTVSVEELVGMLDETVGFITERVEHGNLMKRLSQSVSHCKNARCASRLF